MIRFIWNNWWRHPERFLLLLVGMLIISSTLSYFVGVTESNNGTTQEILQKRWKAAYHIVVRPEGSRSVTEQDQLLEPNYLSGLYGGISLNDYTLIKNMPDVEVAAPLAPVGYSGTSFSYGKVEKPKEPGIYRHIRAAYSNDGVQIVPRFERTFYYTQGLWSISREEQDALQRGVLEPYGVETWILELNGFFGQLLVGIDPEAEARLIGLDQAIVPVGKSRYFSEHDKAETTDSGDGRKMTKLPILMSSRMDSDFWYEDRYERLNLPFSTKDKADQTMREVKNKGGVSFLDQQETVGEPLKYSFDSNQAHALLLSSLSGIDSKTGKPFLAYQNNNQSARISPVLSEKPSSLFFEKVASPYPERWNYAFSVQAIEPKIPQDVQEHYLYTADDFPNSFRPFQLVENWNWSHLIDPYWIGFYDPERLAISKDPINELPMETYRPAEARLVLDKDEKPLNPSIPLYPSLNPFGLLTSPPLLLTTIDAAAQLVGDKPIASIRLKVKGVDSVNEASQQKLEEVAKEIEKRTGLIADITLGSSPQPVLVRVPENGAFPEMGWLEQIFVKLGTVFTLFHETKLGFSGIMGIVMLMAATYVFATNLVTLYARTSEFGLLVSIGWRPIHVVGIIFLEACMLGGMVTLISWAIVGAVVLQHNAMISLGRVFLIGSFGFVIYVLAAVPAAFMVGKISPFAMLRTGELQPGTRRMVRVQGIFSLARGHLLAKFRRSLLSIFAMAVPTGLLVFFGFVTFRLQGMMYTSWLGQFVAVEIGQAHYVAMVLALVIAILTTAEIIWQNVMERKAELLLLKAMGWRNGAIFRLILWEGLLCGLLAAFCGLGLGVLVIVAMYQQFPTEDILLLLSAGLIPILVGMLGAAFPAVMAVRFHPAEGMRGSQKNRRKAERMLRLMMAVLLMCCIVGATVSAILLWQTPASQQETVSEQPPIVQLVPSGDAASIEGGSSKEEAGLGNLTGFVPQPIPDGSKANYDLSLHMKPNGSFVAEATIQVENRSADTWDSVVFYFIPNVFTKENKPGSIKGDADVRIINVELNQEQAKYHLTYDTLELPLENKMAPGQKKEVRVSYTFTVPEDGLRFDKMGQRYFLAQFYPMLATYQNGWSKHDYRVNGESYHTDHADFKLRYEVPPGYQVITTSDEDGAEAKESGEVTVSKVRELYVAVVKGVDSLSQEVNGVQIRVFGEKTNPNQLEAALQAASDALPYFSSKIGLYPHKQLDILVDGRVSMEYPGVITVAAQENLASLRQTIVHELAHQWFYGVVVNDSYQEGWLDEGFAELSSMMFFMDHDKISEQKVWERTKAAAQLAKGKPSNLALDAYKGEIYGAFYAVPSLRLWELISTYGDVSDGWRFLQSYYEQYAYKQVDTKEFVRFVTAYFPVKENYFSDWLKL
ncbi:FtsX-like permease family protein [Brevibacillus reuszeri]|uniref:FtsX-like permease family protein n=1 Tax=Brevibacillus reuszeri TaxID=54915 RepID=UPI000CCC45B5|nr:FtsX-like permease family protein [Brevibacillus reuszeri]